LKAKSAFDPAPEAAVDGGAFAYGRYGTPFLRANMLDVEKPFHYRVPRVVKDLRLKEWQAYQFGDQRWFFFSALYNAKLCSLALFIAYDRERKRRYGFRRVLPGGIFRFGESLSGSDVYYRGARTLLESACDYDSGSMQLTVVRGGRNAGRRFSGRFRFSCGPKAAAPNVVCLPLGLNRAMYSTKILMPMEGEFSIGGESFHLEGPSSMGVIDDHKGFYPYRMRYDWVSGFGADPKGRRVGFNLTDNQVRDQARYNENCLWINNKVWPLPPVKVTRPQGSAGEWIIQDTEGMVDLIFAPALANDIRFNLGLIECDYNGPLGAFRGELRNGEGEKIQADCLFGAGEKKYLRA
jgi:Protein of unknown function (DUF2804).